MNLVTFETSRSTKPPLIGPSLGTVLCGGVRHVKKNWYSGVTEQGHQACRYAAKAVPFVAAHLAGWQRPEDFGFIAERDGAAIGAAWARQFAPDEQPAFFVAEDTPEITIGVKPHLRGRGAPLRARRVLPCAGVRRSQHGRPHVIRAMGTPP